MNDYYAHTEYPEEEDFDPYINLDSPDIEHFIFNNPDTQEPERCVKVTTLDYNGDPAHSIYNLESLEYLLSALLDCKTSLIQTLELDAQGEN